MSNVGEDILRIVFIMSWDFSFGILKFTFFYKCIIVFPIACMGVTFRFPNTYKEINRMCMGIEIAYILLAKHCHHAEGYTHLLRVRVNLYIYRQYS